MTENSPFENEFTTFIDTYMNNNPFTIDDIYTAKKIIQRYEINYVRERASKRLQTYIKLSCIANNNAPQQNNDTEFDLDTITNYITRKPAFDTSSIIVTDFNKYHYENSERVSHITISVNFTNSTINIKYENVIKKDLSITTLSINSDLVLKTTNIITNKAYLNLSPIRVLLERENMNIDHVEFLSILLRSFDIQTPFLNIVNSATNVPRDDEFNRKYYLNISPDSGSDSDLSLDS